MANEVLPIDTPRLRIRIPEPADLAPLVEMLTDPVTMAFWPRPYTSEEVIASADNNLISLRESGLGRLSIIEKFSSRFVADAGIVALIINAQPVNDLGYIVHHPFWNRGYGTEVAGALLGYGFSQLGLEALHAAMPFDHHASRRVAEKIGMRKVAEFNNERNRGIRTLLYRISADEWRTSALRRCNDAGDSDNQSNDEHDEEHRF